MEQRVSIALLKQHSLLPTVFTMSLRSYFVDPTEPQVLILSIWVTTGFSILGVILGLVAGSQAIIFDGVFALVDALMTVLSLFVARLLARERSRRFQYGYWHLEPLVAAFNGSVLLFLCLYALVNAIRGLLVGGSEVPVGAAAVYAVIVCIACVAMYIYQYRANRRHRSELIRIDMQSFIMSAAITVALFAGFALAATVESWGWTEISPYADSIVLMMLAIGLLPIPIRILNKAIREVFLIAPPELHAQVRQAVQQVVSDNQFIGFESYVAKTGRMNQVEIHILVPTNYHAEIAVFDSIRQRIADLLGPSIRLDQWLSINFTAKPEWT